jgi:hypothetical protein
MYRFSAFFYQDTQGCGNLVVKIHETASKPLSEFSVKQ